MAILNTDVGVTSTTIYTSTNDSAVTFMSVCNHGGAPVVCDIHVIPSGGSASNSRLLISDLTIAANDTYILYHGSEKIILGNGDFIAVTSDLATVTALVSYVAV